VSALLAAVIVDPGQLARAVALVTRYESTRTNPWRTEDPPAEFYAKLATAIVSEMPIHRMGGKFKLGQNRSQEDRLGVLAGLEAEGSSMRTALAGFIKTLSNL
jgi:transcriptional regulator